LSTLTRTVDTGDRHVVRVITAMNAPATMSTFSYSLLVASTNHIVKPDWSSAATVLVALTKIQTGSPAHTSRADLQ